MLNNVSKRMLCLASPWQPSLQRLQRLAFSHSAPSLSSVQKDQNDGNRFEHLADTHHLKTRLRTILKEYDHLKYTTGKAPSHLREEHVRKLFDKPSKSQRIKYLKALWRNESIDLLREEEKKAKQAERIQEWQEKGGIDEYTYGLWHNSMFIRIRDTTQNNFYDLRLAYACMYGQSIVIDFEYDGVMQEHECTLAAHQIRTLHNLNRMDHDPFHLHFCNAGPSNLLLNEVLKGFSNKHGFVDITGKSYMDIFPREKLVYLTPHARNTLDRYKADTVYIIGGFVDKTVQKPISLSKAKKEGIKTAKLPIDEYVHWKQGTKNLKIDTVFRILLEFKNTKDWKKAFQHLPMYRIFADDAQNL